VLLAKHLTLKVPLSGAYTWAQEKRYGDLKKTSEVGDLRWTSTEQYSNTLPHITDKFISSRFQLSGNSKPFELHRYHKK